MVAFYTNIWNHYTTNIGQRMADILGEDNFRLVLTSPIEEEPEFKSRGSMGWNFTLPSVKWLVPNPKRSADFKGSEHVRLMEKSDVVIVGALYGERSLFKAYQRRMSSGKLTFINNERFFKEYPTFWDRFNIIDTLRIYKWHRMFSRENVHYLSISHWGYEDMRYYDACHNRVWRWAYTPEVSKAPTVKKDKSIMRVGWCGRMIPWKHVEYMIESMALLPEEYLKRCRMTLVGEGECKESLIKLTKIRNLEDYVEFLPYMPVSEVTKLMGDLDVYILPSDRGEGWGVVLAEAMDKCCVPISCVEAGATLDLIDDGENGFVFEKGDCRRVARKLMWLIDHPLERHMMGIKAWETMQKQTPEIAARRLCDLIEAIQTGNTELIPHEGLCSRVTH